jgi:hypothetical protein
LRIESIDAKQGSSCVPSRLSAGIPRTHTPLFCPQKMLASTALLFSSSGTGGRSGRDRPHSHSRFPVWDISGSPPTTTSFLAGSGWQVVSVRLWLILAALSMSCHPAVERRASCLLRSIPMSNHDGRPQFYAQCGAAVDPVLRKSGSWEAPVLRVQVGLGACSSPSCLPRHLRNIHDSIRLDAVAVVKFVVRVVLKSSLLCSNRQCHKIAHAWLSPSRT